MEDHKDIQGIFDSVRPEGLTDLERAHMRGSLLSYISDHPARAPWHVRFLDTLDTATSFTAVSRPLFASALAVVLVAGVGTSFAAETALPGDLLYPVKVNVTESLRGSLTFNDEKQVKWYAEVTERRLLEAEELAAQGLLTPEAAREIATRVEKSAGKIDSRIAKIGQEPQNATIVADVHSEFEASLRAHDEVLTLIANSVPDAEGALTPILATVRDREAKARSARTNAEEVITIARADLKEVVNEKRKKAQERVTVAKSKANDAKKLGDSAKERASARNSLVEKSISDADAKLEAGEYGSAYGTLTGAIRAAKENITDVDANVRIMQRTGKNFATSLAISTKGSGSSSSGTGEQESSTATSISLTISSATATSTSATLISTSSTSTENAENEEDDD